MNSITALPLPPASLHQPRGWMWRVLGRAYLRLGGWRIEGAFPEEPKFVTIVAPHTSNWDFVVGVAVVFALELRVSWLGKHSLFQTPLRRFFLWMGGIPVNRQVSHGVVDACVKAFEGVPARLLALAPEGTRKGVSQWRSGFYWIATASGVPIWPVGFDFRNHVIRLMPVFHPTGSLEADLPRIQAMFSGVRGLRERSARSVQEPSVRGHPCPHKNLPLADAPGCGYSRACRGAAPPPGPCLPL